MNDNNDSNKEGLRYLFQKQDKNWGLDIKFEIESRNPSLKIVGEDAYLYQLENLNGSTLLKKWNWWFSLLYDGKNIIKMTDLKRVFESIEFYEVKTYIQSGNVLFKSNEAGESLNENHKSCFISK